MELWDIPERKLRTTLKKHKGEVLAIAFSSDSKLLATGGQDKLVMLWKVPAAKPKE
jgi:WD40 repeat protein